MKFDIPTSITGAGKRLTSLDSLATATEWERAAIVATFVTITPNGKGLDGTMSSQGFAELGFAGLTSEKTVRRYHDAWMNHSGLDRPVPGEQFTADLPPWGDAVPARKTKADDIAQQPGAVAEALSENPEFVAKVRKRMNPKARKQVADQMDSATDEFKRKAAHTAEQEEASRARRPWLFYQAQVAKARLAIKVAMNEVGDPRRFSEDERGILFEEVSTMIDGLMILREVIDGGKADRWDEALEALTASGDPS